MKYIVCISILLTVIVLRSSPVVGSSIDISCEYDFVRTEIFEQFVKKEKNNDFYKMHNWWEFHKKRQMNFSIDQNTKSVTCGFTGDNFCTPSNTTSDVYPDEIYIDQRGRSENNYKPRVNEFWIDRDSGNFQGIHYEPNTKTHIEAQVYLITGKCRPIKKLF